MHELIYSDMGSDEIVIYGFAILAVLLLLAFIFLSVYYVANKFGAPDYLSYTLGGVISAGVIGYYVYSNWSRPDTVNKSA